MIIEAKWLLKYTAQWPKVDQQLAEELAIRRAVPVAAARAR
jgi:hypothetical protein